MRAVRYMGMAHFVRTSSLTRDKAILTIRPAQAADTGAIGRIVGAAIRDGTTYALPRDMTDAAAAAYWMAPDRYVFVAETAGTILGTYYLRANQLGGGAHVANAGYVTATEASGRGIARQMAAHSLEVARERGFKAMQFNFVVASNDRAIRLWRHLGFEIVGRLPGAFAHPTLGFVDALVMYRRL